MKSGKRYMTEMMELQNQEKIKKPGEKETHKYLRILEADTIKQVKTKEKIKRTRNLLETKLYNRKLIKGINSLAVPNVRYSRTILEVN